MSSGSGPESEFPSCAHSKKTHGSPQENSDGRCVNQESTKLGNPILTGCIGDANEQRRDEWPAQAAEAADGDDDQEVDEVLVGIGPLHRQDVRAQRATEAGE